MELFDFPYHTVETKNPEAGYRGQLGGSYVFTSPPTDPDQRTFTLTFPAMQFFVDASKNLDALIYPQRNMKTLINFYLAHKMHESFLYNHPVHGQVEVKFSKPLEEPAGLPGGNGVVKEFSVELIEIP